MKCWKLAALVSTLTSLFLASSAALTQDNLRLDPNVAPVEQSIELFIDAQSTDYHGTVKMELAVKQPAATFRFHAREMILEEVKLFDGENSVAVAVQEGEEGLQTATPETSLAPGRYRLQISFHKPYNTQAVGLYRVVQDSVGYLFTQFEAVDARRAFPCWDEPGYKIPYQLTLHIPEGQVALTNTPLLNRSIADGIQTLLFEETPPLPSYLLAIAAGPLESVEIANLSVPGRIYTVRGKSQLGRLAASLTPSILRALEEYFGIPYPFAKLDLIAIPEYWPGAMENPGAVTYAENILLVDSSQAGISQRRILSYVTAHELAHMWFGDLVTMSWWDDLWLNESFADWMGEKIADQLYPQYRLRATALDRLQSLMSLDARLSTKPIRKKVEASADIFEDLGLSYGKGRRVLGMVEQWLGAEIFRTGVLNYLNKHARGNTTAADLWEALSQASGQDVSKILRGFLDQPGYPLIRVTEQKDGSIQISQQRYHKSGVEAPVQTWTVPVFLKYGNASGVQTKNILLDGPSAVVNLGKDIRWILPNAGAYGYYRWSIPDRHFSTLAQRPNEIMDEGEQIAFLGNARALMDAGQLSSNRYLAILSGFGNSQYPAVISTMLDDLAGVRAALVPDDLRGAFGAFVRTTLEPILQRFGKEKRPGEAEAVSLLRPDLLDWLGEDGGSAAVRSYARELAARYINDPASVDPALASVALRLAAIDGTVADFETYRIHFEKAANPTERRRFLSALGAFSDTTLQNRALNYSLQGPLHANEVFAIANVISDSESGIDRVFRWITRNYGQIAAKLPPEFLGSLVFQAGGCSQERVATARRFFSEPDHHTANTERNLAKVEEQVGDCVRLREREGGSTREFLLHYVANADTD